MNIYLGFDDTDDKDAPMGTGRLVRNFIYALPQEYRTIGVVRHQLPRLEDIPYTSNNSSACAIIEVLDGGSAETLEALATEHLLAYCAPGSDPGLCVASEEAVTQEMVAFGQAATGTVLTQKAAMDTARSVRLHGLGGTNDGIIGACAAVGLTRFGWSGRFIEFGRLRSLTGNLCVRDLAEAGIQVVSVDRDPLVPLPSDRLDDAWWIRPSLWAGHPVLQVRAAGPGVWTTAHGKRGKGHGPETVTPLCTAV